MVPTQGLAQRWSGLWRQQKQKRDFAHSGKPDPHSNQCCGCKFQGPGGPPCNEVSLNLAEKRHRRDTEASLGCGEGNRLSSRINLKILGIKCTNGSTRLQMEGRRRKRKTRRGVRLPKAKGSWTSSC